MGFGGKLLKKHFPIRHLKNRRICHDYQSMLSDTSKFVSAIFMIIGGSPGGHGRRYQNGHYSGCSVQCGFCY